MRARRRRRRPAQRADSLTAKEVLRRGLEDEPPAPPANEEEEMEQEAFEALRHSFEAWLLDDDH